MVTLRVPVKILKNIMNAVKRDTRNKKKRPETYTLKFIDSYRFMTSKLQNLVNNLV